MRGAYATRGGIKMGTLREMREHRSSFSPCLFLPRREERSSSDYREAPIWTTGVTRLGNYDGVSCRARCGRKQRGTLEVIR